MGTNDWALQHIKSGTRSNKYPRVRGLLQKTVETSTTSNFEEAMDVLDKSLDVMGNGAESNSNSLRNVDVDLKAIVHSLKGDSDDVQESALGHHPSKLDEVPTKQFERCLQG
jgi:hypothetical protein